MATISTDRLSRHFHLQRTLFHRGQLCWTCGFCGQWDVVQQPQYRWLLAAPSSRQQEATSDCGRVNLVNKKQPCRPGSTFEGIRSLLSPSQIAKKGCIRFTSGFRQVSISRSEKQKCADSLAPRPRANCRRMVGQGSAGGCSKCIRSLHALRDRQPTRACTTARSPSLIFSGRGARTAGVQAGRLRPMPSASLVCAPTIWVF